MVFEVHNMHGPTVFRSPIFRNAVHDASSAPGLNAGTYTVYRGDDRIVAFHDSFYARQNEGCTMTLYIPFHEFMELMDSDSTNCYQSPKNQRMRVSESGQVSCFGCGSPGSISGEPTESGSYFYVCGRSGIPLGYSGV